MSTDKTDSYKTIYRSVGWGCDRDTNIRKSFIIISNKYQGYLSYDDIGCVGYWKKLLYGSIVPYYTK